MQQNEVFKRITSKIKGFEEQLSLCHTSMRECEQSGKEAEKMIADHFDKVMNELASHKASLLNEVAHNIATYSMNPLSSFLSFLFLLNSSWLYVDCCTGALIQDSQVKIENSIATCQPILKAGETCYPFGQSAAENIWNV